MSMPTLSPGWYVISLRPRGGHAGLRRAAHRYGAGLVALSPWQLQPRDAAAARHALQQALTAARVVFTSPAAVRAAHRLQRLDAVEGRQWFAVGAATAAALRRCGVAHVLAPARMDSEGLLGLPSLQALTGSTVGLVTAPGGRGALAPALQARGARVLRADVYERVLVVPTPRAIAALCALRVPAVLALSSGEALQQALAALPAPAGAALRRAGVAAASERLAALAREHGFVRIAVAAGPRPAQLLAAAAALVPAAAGAVAEGIRAEGIAADGIAGDGIAG